MAIERLGPVGFFATIWREVNQDNLFTWASALAYSWLFAIFPFLVFLLSLIPLLPTTIKAKAKHQIAVAVYHSLPHEAANVLWDFLWPRLDEVMVTPIRGLLSIGVVITLWAASGGVNATMSALDRCYDVKVKRPFYTQRPLAVGLTLIVTSLILSVLVLIPIGTIVTKWTMSLMADHQIVRWMPLILAWEVARWLIALGMLFCALGTLYHFGPNLPQRWHIITPGAVFSIGVWLILGWLFRLYIDRYGKYNQTYGTVGGVAILLLLFYIDALVLLIGAEINSVIDDAVDGLDAPPESKKAADMPQTPA